MSEFYLVKDGQRIVSLAAERDGKLYAFVPNVNSFVYNKPMSVDFQIDGEMNYEPVSTDTAVSIVRDGSIGEIDESTNEFLLDHVVTETRRIDPDELLSESANAGTEITLAQAALAVADTLRSVPLGRWITYTTYPLRAREAALQLVSDLRDGLVPALSGIPLVPRLRDDTDDTQVVEVRRTSRANAAKSGRSAPTKATKKAAAKKVGDKVPVKGARGVRAPAAKANVGSRAKSR
jgi:hypothetical protein